MTILINNDDDNEKLLMSLGLIRAISLLYSYTEDVGKNDS